MYLVGPSYISGPALQALSIRIKYYRWRLLSHKCTWCRNIWHEKYISEVVLKQPEALIDSLEEIWPVVIAYRENRPIRIHKLDTKCQRSRGAMFSIEICKACEVPFKSNRYLASDVMPKYHTLVIFWTLSRCEMCLWKIYVWPWQRQSVNNYDLVQNM